MISNKATVLILLLAACTSSAQDRAASEQVPETDKQFLLTYPKLDNSGGEVLLENEHVVVQRFVVGPGEWEGIHAHPGNQVYVHVKGGEWSGLSGGRPTYSGSVSEDGSVGWMDPIPLSEGHESGNTGDTPIDLIWVTLKDDAPIAPEIEHAPLSNQPSGLVSRGSRSSSETVMGTLARGLSTATTSRPSNLWRWAALGPSTATGISCAWSPRRIA